MPDPTGFSWKEAAEFIEQRLLFGRHIVPVLGMVLVLAAGIWGFKYIYSEALKPISVWISQRGTAVDQWAALLIVMLLGFVVVGIALFETGRRALNRDKIVAREIGTLVDAHFEAVEARLDHLESATASLATAGRLESRLSKLEPLPDEVRQHTDEDAMKRAILIHLLTSRTDVKSPRSEAKGSDSPAGDS